MRSFIHTELFHLAVDDQVLVCEEISSIFLLRLQEPMHVYFKLYYLLRSMMYVIYNYSVTYVGYVG